jgi:hypothetical protein
MGIGADPLRQAAAVAFGVLSDAEADEIRGGMLPACADPS